MTWVVGVATLQGFAILGADLRVSFGDGRSDDCLQKLHRVGPEMILGFAGSVCLGFRVREAIEDRAAREGWPSITELANTWLPRECRHVFERGDPAERRLGLSLIIGGPHPSRGAPPPLNFPFTEIYALHATRFSLERIAAGQAAAIGTGAAAYRDVFASLVSNKMFTHSDWSFQDQMTVLAALMRAHVEGTPTKTVGADAFVGFATRDAAGVQPFCFAESGARARFPKTVATYDEFKQHCSRMGVSAASASC